MGVGKLNYVNRKSEGVKLGSIVAKDVRKKAMTAVTKDESKRDITVLEICLTGKKLTDEGVAEMATGLVDALSRTYTDGTPCLVLEELQLSGNYLTARCLPELAKVIRASASYIKDFDLSSNNISVQTQTEADNWRDFLQSFRYASCMRRLVISKNNLSGPTAMEILAQVYSHHPQVIPDEVRSVSKTNGAVPGDKITAHIRESSAESSVSTTPTKPKLGLRSIPYIVISDVKLDDLGVLWLSYCLEAHYNPDRLMTPIKVGPIATLLSSYKETTNCDGIVYKPNNNVRAYGWRTISAAEASRNAHAKENGQVLDDSGSGASTDSDHDQQEKTRRGSSSEYDIFELSGRRKSSVYATDLNTLRRKLQRTAMEDYGYRKIELWTAALKVVSLSRTMLSYQLPCLSHGVPMRWGNLSSDQNGPASSNFKSSLTDIFAKRPVLVAQPKVKQTKSALERLNTLNRREYDDKINLGKLPRSILDMIIQLSADPRMVLTPDQIKQAIDFGMDRRTLAEEREAQAKGVTHQIWRLLEATDCLAYKIIT